MATTGVILVVISVIVAMVLIVRAAVEKSHRNHFFRMFGQGAPSKNACEQEKKILRRTTQKTIRNLLTRANARVDEQQTTNNLGDVRLSHFYELEERQKAKHAFYLANKFGLVPEDVETPEAFVALTDSDLTSDK